MEHLRLLQQFPSTLNLLVPQVKDWEPKLQSILEWYVLCKDIMFYFTMLPAGLLLFAGLVSSSKPMSQALSLLSEQM